MSSRTSRQFCAVSFLALFFTVAPAVGASELAGTGFVSSVPGADIFSPIIIRETETPAKKDPELADASIPMAKELWVYLRAGINYVESSGEDFAPRFVHPGGKAYGALAMTPIAIKDVIIHYKEFAGYSVDDVLNSRALYERCALYFADLLLRRYLKLSYNEMDRRELFLVLQRAWFLGPTLYKKGTVPVPASREHNSEEFLSKASVYSAKSV